MPTPDRGLEPGSLRALEVFELFKAAPAVSVAPLEAVALLPAVQVVVEVLEALVERRVVGGELGEGDGDGQGDVREDRLVATEDPISPVGEMPGDEGRVGERLLAAVLASPGVVRQLELEAEARVHDVEHGDDAVQNMHPDAVVPHRILPC